jgi:hypothetical protein
MLVRAVLPRSISVLLVLAVCAAGAAAYVASGLVDKAQAQTRVINLKRARAVAKRVTRTDCEDWADFQSVANHRDLRCESWHVFDCWREDLYRPNVATCPADFYVEDFFAPDVVMHCSRTHYVDYYPKSRRYQVRSHSFFDYHCVQVPGVPG